MLLAKEVKICPVCETANHPSTTLCSTCGALLGQKTSLHFKDSPLREDNGGYDFRFGEADLLEQTAHNSARISLGVALVGFILLALGAGVLLFNSLQTSTPTQPLDPALPDAPRPTLNLATVTQGPPTATATYTPSPTFTPSVTPTPMPCVQRIPSGGSLIGVITACGHRSLDVMPTVLALNNISDPSQVRAGQEVIIPLPTETLDPNRPMTETPIPASGSRDDNSNALLSLNTSIDAFAPTATPTLPVGVMWHSVRPNDNVTVIALLYNANAKVLSELNPEIDFARCEFGERFGGPECIVQLSIGQQVRVPAPTPTPTLSPTPDPNATATPTPTPTYNKPNVASPSDRQFFGVDDLISLRWIPTATLRENEAYRVDVTDLTSGISYTALTKDIFFLVPLEWQGKTNARHEYRWTVGIVNTEAIERITFQTEPRTFVWQGRLENES